MRDWLVLYRSPTKVVRAWVSEWENLYKKQDVAQSWSETRHFFNDEITKTWNQISITCTSGKKGARMAYGLFKLWYKSHIYKPTPFFNPIMDKKLLNALHKRAVWHCRQDFATSSYMKMWKGDLKAQYVLHLAESNRILL